MGCEVKVAMSAPESCFIRQRILLVKCKTAEHTIGDGVYVLLQSWPSNMSQHLTLLPREEALEPKRVMSVFRERVEKHKEEIAELEEREKLVEKEKPVST
jgi:hypothetical protein